MCEKQEGAHFFEKECVGVEDKEGIVSINKECDPLVERSALNQEKEVCSTKRQKCDYTQEGVVSFDNDCVTTKFRKCTFSRRKE